EAAARAVDAADQAALKVRTSQLAISESLALRWRQLIWMAGVGCLLAVMVALLWNSHLRTLRRQIRIQETLNQSEEQFRLLFEEAPVGYCELGQDGIVKRV